MKKAHIIGIVIIAVAIAAIMSTIADSSTYASFSTAIANAGKEYHVVGKLDKTKAYDYNPQQNANIFGFYLIDNEGQAKKVMFNGTKPQDFEKSEQIVIVGKMSGEEFHASSILMKCPSKYNNPKEQLQLKEYKANT